MDLVDTYNDPLKALSNFKTDLYDLVLLDIRLRISNELFGSKGTRLTN